MTAKSRILCCSNNRAAVADAFTPPSDLQILKPKTISRSESFETVNTLTTCKTELTADTTPLDKEQVSPEEQSIFGSQTFLSDEIEDMMTLKRANPVYDSDDEQDLVSEYESPTKRLRRNLTSLDLEDDHELECGESIQLLWSDRISEEGVEGFVLTSSPRLIAH